MKLESISDIAAPIDFVFAQMTDFAAMERAAMRRGSEVQRIDTLTRKGPGMAWEARFEMRGKPRELRLELSDYTPPEGIGLCFASSSINGTLAIEMVALSRTRTRVTMALKVVPETLTGKLLVQSMKLARKTLTERIDKRMATYCADIEKRHRQRATSNAFYRG